MATINPTFKWHGSHTVVITWANLTTTNADGEWISDKFMDYADRTIHVSGTLGVGGAVDIEGDNTGNAANAAVLNDAQGNALSVTSLKIEQLLENPLRLRPNVSGGDGTTDLTVTMVCRRTRAGKEI